MAAGGGVLTGKNLGGFGLGGIQIGGYPAPRWRVDLLLLGVGANFTEESGLTASLKNQFELAADLSGRYYLTPEHTFLGVYPLAGFRFGTLFWDYANPILIEEDGETRKVEGDLINYYAPYVGLGTSLVQTRHFHLGGNLTVGARFYDAHTNEGLRNDLFRTAAFAQFLVETTVLF